MSTYDTQGTRAFYVGVFYTLDGNQPPGHLSDKVAVTWADDES